MPKEFIQMPAKGNNFPVVDDNIETHAMNDNEAFRDRILTMGKARTKIKEKLQAGEITQEEADHSLDLLRKLPV